MNYAHSKTSCPTAEAQSCLHLYPAYDCDSSSQPLAMRHPMTGCRISGFQPQGGCMGQGSKQAALLTLRLDQLGIIVADIAHGLGNRVSPHLIGLVRP